MTRFWDTSSIIPLLLQESATARVLALLREDRQVIVWWGTHVECVSAISRRVREGGLDPTGGSQAGSELSLLASKWNEVQPSYRLRDLAERLMALYPLRAADALQLAAAVIWSDGEPGQRPLVCLDVRLREAAQKEGFTVQPTV